MGEDGRDSRKAILKKARRAAQRAYGTSMDYITRNAGVSKGVVYWYFPENGRSIKQLCDGPKTEADRPAPGVDPGRP